MAFEQNLHPVSIPASTDQSAKQFYVVDLTTSGQTVVQTTSGGIAVGIQQDKVKNQGDASEVAVPGPTIVKGIAGAAFNNGAELMCDTGGKLITATGGGHYVLARALAAAGGANEIVAVLLVGPYYKA